MDSDEGSETKAHERARCMKRPANVLTQRSAQRLDAARATKPRRGGGEGRRMGAPTRGGGAI